MALAGYPKTYNHPTVELLTAVNDTVNLRDDISKISYIKTNGVTSTDWVELYVGINNSNKTGSRTDSYATGESGWTNNISDTYQIQDIPDLELVDSGSVSITVSENTGSYGNGVFTLADSEIASITTGGLITVGGSNTSGGFNSVTSKLAINYETVVKVRMTIGDQLYGPFNYVKWIDEGATGLSSGQGDIYISVFKTEH